LEYCYCPFCGDKNYEFIQFEKEKVELTYFQKFLSIFYVDEVHDFFNRLIVLIILLIIQSISGFILGLFGDLVRRNVIITLFLTVLVGAGGKYINLKLNIKKLKI
jgi:hypothetical protein